MAELFAPLVPADYHFLLGVIESDVNLTDDRRLKQLLSVYEHDGTERARETLNVQLEREIRYLGSSDVAYFLRYARGGEPGVPVREVIRDVARALKIELPLVGTDRELAERLVERYVSQQFAELSRDRQQQLLEDLGVERDKAASFLKKSAGVFAVPLLVQAFGTIVVDGLIKTVIFGTIAKLVGRQLSMQLFRFIAGRFPWWIRWIGPMAWTVSIGWTALDLQGPAMRKTIPVVLYLGLCSLRESHDGEAEASRASQGR